MEWADWVYFENNWEDDPRIGELRRLRITSKITRAEYKSGVQAVKKEILERMLRDGRITKEDLENPGPPPETKPRRPYVGKKVSIGKAVPAHGRLINLRLCLNTRPKFQEDFPAMGRNNQQWILRLPRQQAYQIRILCGTFAACANQLIERQQGPCCPLGRVCGDERNGKCHITRVY
jgi:hypothetical protein